MDKGYTIGQIASHVGVTVDTIRVYERYGLIEKPQRRPNGYRHYSKQFITRISFIKWAKVSGFTLKEIKELLAIDIEKSSSYACKEALHHVEIKLSVIEKKIKVLVQFKKALKSIINNCDTTGTNCPILEALKKIK